MNERRVLPTSPVTAPMPPVQPTRGPSRPRRVDDVTSDNIPTRKQMPVPGGNEVRLMALKDRYVMVRRPGSIPFVMTLHDWLELEDVKA